MLLIWNFSLCFLQINLFLMGGGGGIFWKFVWIWLFYTHFNNRAFFVENIVLQFSKTKPSGPNSELLRNYKSLHNWSEQWLFHRKVSTNTGQQNKLKCGHRHPSMTWVHVRSDMSEPACLAFILPNVSIFFYVLKYISSYTCESFRKLLPLLISPCLAMYGYEHRYYCMCCKCNVS
jgi:hypothetical protein